MRNVSADLIDSETLCWVWVLTLKDESKLGFTNHDRQLEFQSILCDPQSGFTAGDVDARLGFSTNTGSVRGILDGDALSEHDIREGRFEGAKLATYRVDWTNADHYVRISTGYIGELRQQGEAFVAEWLGEASRLERSTGRVFSRACDAEFGDARCGLDVSAFPEGTICPRTFAACRDQFSNSVNYRGFPYLIGDDALVAGPKEGELRDGGSRYT